MATPLHVKLWVLNLSTRTRTRFLFKDWLDLPDMGLALTKVSFGPARIISAPGTIIQCEFEWKYAGLPALDVAITSLGVSSGEVQIPALCQACHIKMLPQTSGKAQLTFAISEEHRAGLSQTLIIQPFASVRGAYFHSDTVSLPKLSMTTPVTPPSLSLFPEVLCYTIDSVRTFGCSNDQTSEPASLSFASHHSRLFLPLNVQPVLQSS